MEETEEPEEPEEVAPAFDPIMARRSAYQNESDPLFFEWQRGEATEQDWLDAVAAIKAQYPKPVIE